MTQEFVPYEQASALKGLGFDEPCILSYRGLDTQPVCQMGYEFKTEKNSDYNDETNYWLTVPTYSQAFRWFREKYDLVHEISWSKYKGGLNFDYDVFSLVLPTDDELGDEDDIASDKSMETYDSLVDKDFRHHESNTYEEAELACLKKLIEIAQTK